MTLTPAHRSEPADGINRWAVIPRPDTPKHIYAVKVTSDRAEAERIAAMTLGTIAPVIDVDALKAHQTFVHVAPRTDACEHDFQGWRPFADGNGGEQVCTKCGIGAMAYSLAVGP